VIDQFGNIRQRYFAIDAAVGITGKPAGIQTAASAAWPHGGIGIITVGTIRNQAGGAEAGAIRTDGWAGAITVGVTIARNGISTGTILIDAVIENR
jgi:hypothetical protein